MSIEKPSEMNSIVTTSLKNIHSELFAMQEGLAPYLSDFGQWQLDKTVTDFMGEIYNLHERIKNCYWTP